MSPPMLTEKKVPFPKMTSLPDSFDSYLNAELLLPDSGDNVVPAHVVKRAKGEDVIQSAYSIRIRSLTLVHTLLNFLMDQLPSVK